MTSFVCVLKAHITLLSFAALLLLASSPLATAQLTSGSSCAAVLSAGIFNSIETSLSGASYTSFQSSMCSFSSSYTYQQYYQEATSSNVNSQYVQVNINACVLRIVCGGAGGGWANTAIAQEQFRLYQQYVTSYQAAQCGSVGQISDSSSSYTFLKRWVDPAVMDAYLSCLKLFTAGIQISQTSAVDATSLVFSLKFVPTAAGANAVLTGMFMSPSNLATCTLVGQSIHQNIVSGANLQITLRPLLIYSLFCSAIPCRSGNSSCNAIDVFLTTTVSEPYHAILYRTPQASELAQVRALVSVQRTLIASLQTETASLRTRVISMEGRAASLERAVREVKANNTALSKTITGMLAGSVTFKYLKVVESIFTKALLVNGSAIISGTLNVNGRVTALEVVASTKVLARTVVCTGPEGIVLRGEGALHFSHYDGTVLWSIGTYRTNVGNTQPVALYVYGNGNGCVAPGQDSW
eukprot:CAMPEP_0184654966 /NCGR_PEP_ID=MMETSP0308-20130426/12612_1 /TAXON_ID=38269 /ORGANISM="Gloeochaete witrockiana, Strain SAG 46.84" /LENGTH=466 /DNA_ID=CAMNT_0027091191 /DNA_START=319 /DNA_END=1716 /DNA_ORIENTATION=+